MTHITKSEQWKRGAIVLAWIDAAAPNEPQSIRDFRARNALRAMHIGADWHYDWSEVIRSLRERSSHQRDKSATRA